MSDRPPSSRTVFRASPLQELNSTPAAPPASPSLPAIEAPSLAGTARDDIPAPPRQLSPRNPLMAPAASLLALLASVRAGRAQLDLPRLHGFVSAAISQFSEAVRGACPEEHVKRSAYALAATADDIVLNLPGQPEQTAEWARRSMVVRNFGENIGGDRFWVLLDQMIARPSEYGQVIELYHACMAAGFLGRFRVASNGKADHQATMQRAFQALDHPRRVSPTDLSPHWRGVLTEMSSLRFWTPLALAGGSAALLLLLVYGGLEFKLVQDAGPAREALQKFSNLAPLALAREATAPAPAPSTEFQRICGDLKLTITGNTCAGNRVTASDHPRTILFTLSNSILFDSGSDALKRSSEALFHQIAAVMEREHGAITVTGYTDNQQFAAWFGETNMELSQRRADNVALLIRKDLSDSQRVTAVGKGDEDPVASNDTKQGQAINRRVELSLEKRER